VIHMAGGSAGLVILWLTTPRESKNETDNTANVNKEQNEKVKKYNGTTNSKTNQVHRSRKSAKNEFPDIWKRYHIVPTLHAKDIVNIDFKSKQTYATICAPFLLWIGFLGRNVLTNLPQNNIANLAGRRLINTVISGAASFLLGYLYNNFSCKDIEVLPKRNDVGYRSMITMKCFLIGLVSISASCSTCETYGAAAIGVASAIFCICTSRLQRTMGMDPGEMAVSVHLVGTYINLNLLIYMHVYICICIYAIYTYI
jgi:ammonia channel protein AmtB